MTSDALPRPGGPPVAGPGEALSPLPDTESIVQQAIESVLHTAPAPAPGPDEGKSQPWAETAAPAGKNKRPLEDLLEEYAQRVAASPGALAALPRERRPAEAFFERLSRRDSDGGRPGRGRRGRQRSGRRQGQGPGQSAGQPSRGGVKPPQGRPKPPGENPAPRPADGASGARRRRGRRRRR